MNEPASNYRAHYRRQFIGRHYQGWLHFAFTVTMAGSVIAFCASQLHAVSRWEWATVPLTFLYANVAEYFGHRGPMHHRRAGLAKIYERHACQHHVFFTDQAMQYDGMRDWKAVLFPPLLVTFFLAGFGTPVALLLAWLGTPNIAYLFGLTGVAYFLSYELLHFTYHLPPAHLVARLPGMRSLRRHHTIHHDPKLMARHNFNITYPICDWLFGTTYRGGQ
jgi:hypothetical protein